nr:hypothetical protein [Heyndrickxia oleronia]
MQSNNGERKFLFSLYQLLENAQTIKDDNENEFIVIPSETAEKVKESLLVVVNRMEGELFDDE